jgi:hypothetical protein
MHNSVSRMSMHMFMGQKIHDEQNAALLQPLSEPQGCESRVREVVESEPDGGDVEVVEFWG